MEGKILTLAVTALEQSTRTKAPQQMPDWAVTEYDIDIHEDQILGIGGFAKVYKGSWGGTIVAVKRMISDTSGTVGYVQTLSIDCFLTFCPTGARQGSQNLE